MARVWRSRIGEELSLAPQVLDGEILTQWVLLLVVFGADLIKGFKASSTQEAKQGGLSGSESGALLRGTMFLWGLVFLRDKTPRFGFNTF